MGIIDPTRIDTSGVSNKEIENVLIELQMPDFVPNENGIYTPKRDIQVSRGAELFVKALKNKSIFYRPKIPEETYELLGTFWTNTLAAAVDWWNKLTRHGNGLLCSFDNRNNIETLPMSVSDLSKFQTFLSDHQEKGFKIAEEEYDEHKLAHDRLACREVGLTAILMHPFTTLKANDLTRTELTERGRKNCYYLSERSDDDAITKGLKYIGDNFGKVIGLVRKARRSLRC